MTAEPYNEWAIHHLYGTVFCGTFNVFVDFAGASRANAPAGRTFEIARYNESPAREQTLPWSYFYRDTIFHTFERVMDAPVELGVVGFGRWTGPMSIGRMVVSLFGRVVRTLSQRSVPS
jgi:hypothetical protein